MSKEVPFHANSEDGKRCVQACVWMVLEYFLPQNEYNLESVKSITGYSNNKGTWEYKYIVGLLKLGLSVAHISNFNHKKFADDGYAYLLTVFGKEAADWQRDNTLSLADEQLRAKKLVKEGIFKNEEPTLHDLRAALNNGSLIILQINSKKLNEKPGYLGHSIVVIDQDDDGFFVHDPGLPPIKSRYVSNNTLEEAWADPGPDAKVAVVINDS